MKTRDRATVLSLLQAPEPPPELDRTAKYKEANAWIWQQAHERGSVRGEPAYKFMEEIMVEGFDRLADTWHESTDEEFMDELRRYAARCVRALKTGQDAEDEVSRRRGEIVCERQVFEMATGGVK